MHKSDKKELCTLNQPTKRRIIAFIMKTEFDYIIVGAGSAGCVLANRLSENANIEVCLIEAGPPDSNPAIQMPAGVTALMDNPKFNWCYETEPEPHLNNQKIYSPRGKTLGGSSSVNAMVYIRGHKDDYNDWAAQGNEGWSYEEVLPYFKKSESFYAGANEAHGGNGPLPVVQQRYTHSLSRKFIDSAVAAGYTETNDFNSGDHTGIGYFHVNQRDGKRCSAAKAFLHPVKNRANLTVLTDSQVQKILIEDKQATGLVTNIKGQAQTLKAHKEVILSAGVYNTPQLLMLSGIGDSEELTKHGIEVIQDLKGVGKNLQDHVDVFLGRSITTSESYSFNLKGLASSFVGFFQYLFTSKGMLTSVFSEAGGFIKSDDSQPRPDVQLHFIPMLLDNHGRDLSESKKNGYILHACILNPESTGEVTLRDANPNSAPVIRNLFFSAPNDMSRLVNALKKIQNIMNAGPLGELNKDTIFPKNNFKNDQEIVDFIKERGQHLYHGAGSCKMGTDAMSVVSPTLNVHGVSNLRIADASVMPTITRGNTHAASVMIGEKAADMILKDG